jgi:hypothetical protein
MPQPFGRDPCYAQNTGRFEPTATVVMTEGVVMKIKYQLTLAETPEMIERDGFGPPEEWTRLGPATRTTVVGLPLGQEATICRSSAVNPLPGACLYTIQRQQNGGVWFDWGDQYATAESALVALQLEIDRT